MPSSGLGENRYWRVDSNDVHWSLLLAEQAREHQWFTHGCSSCGGCKYSGCTVHELCDCAVRE